MASAAEADPVPAAVVEISNDRRYHGKWMPERTYHGIWMPVDQWIDLIKQTTEASIDGVDPTEFKRQINKKMRNQGGQLAEGTVMHLNRKKISIDGDPVNKDFWCLSTHQTNVYVIKGGPTQVQDFFQERWDYYLRWKVETNPEAPPPAERGTTPNLAAVTPGAHEALANVNVEQCHLEDRRASLQVEIDSLRRQKTALGEDISVFKEELEQLQESKLQDSQEPALMDVDTSEDSQPAAEDSQEEESSKKEIVVDDQVSEDAKGDDMVNEETLAEEPHKSANSKEPVVTDLDNQEDSQPVAEDTREEESSKKAIVVDAQVSEDRKGNNMVNEETLTEEPHEPTEPSNQPRENEEGESKVVRGDTEEPETQDAQEHTPTNNESETQDPATAVNENSEAVETQDSYGGTPATTSAHSSTLNTRTTVGTQEKEKHYRTCDTRVLKQGPLLFPTKLPHEFQVYSCKAVHQPDFVWQHAVKLNSPQVPAPWIDEAVLMFQFSAQSADSVLEEEFIMITDTHFIEMKSSKLDLRSCTVTFAIPIKLLAKLTFRQEESISLFFKSAPNDPLVYMCPDSADAVHQIKAVLKKLGVKGKNGVKDLNEAAREAIKLVNENQAKELALRHDGTVERVNEIMDLYRQAAEGFEAAGDFVRHGQVVTHMRKFLTLPIVMSILDGSYNRNKVSGLTDVCKDIRNDVTISD